MKIAKLNASVKHKQVVAYTFHTSTRNGFFVYELAH
jgi:hypothetical protein